MKILHVCDSIIGGTGSALAELLTPQAALYGPANVLLLMPESHRSYLEPRLLASGIRILSFPRPNRLLGMLALLFVYHLVRLRTRPDLVHAHSFGAGFVTRVVRPRRPFVIYCPHGWAFDMEVSQRVRRIIVAIERWLARAADRIILIAHHEAARAVEVGIPAAKLVPVPNGIEEAPPPVAAAPWEDSRLKLLFVGRFDRQKGIDVLLEAVRPLDGRLALRVIGAPVVSAQAAPRIELDFVEYLGWLDRDVVAAQMKACDVLVAPSRWEGFGLVAIEAMRVGKPVIASAVGGLKEILDDGRFGFCVPPDDPAALRALLARLDRAELRAMGGKGHRRFRDNYMATRMVAEVDRVYRDACHATPPARALARFAASRREADDL